MDNILPKFSKSLEDWERNIKDYNASLLELHQHLIKTTSETCEARLKLQEAAQSITSFLRDTEVFYLLTSTNYIRENPINIPIRTQEKEQDIDEAEIAHNDAESEFLAELGAEHAEENNLPVRE